MATVRTSHTPSIMVNQRVDISKRCHLAIHCLVDHFSLLSFQGRHDLSINNQFSSHPKQQDKQKKGFRDKKYKERAISPTLVLPIQREAKRRGVFQAQSKMEKLLSDSVSEVAHLRMIGGEE